VEGTPREVDAKARAWLAAGSLAVWVVDPVARTVTVYRAPTNIQVLSQGDELSGGDVVPGFSCRIGDIFSSPFETSGQQGVERRS
jgi:Uma2 family endonuclease